MLQICMIIAKMFKREATSTDSFVRPAVKFLVAEHVFNRSHFLLPSVDPAHTKNEKLYFLAQRIRMQPILVSYEAPFRSNFQKNTDPFFFCSPVPETFALGTDTFKALRIAKMKIKNKTYKCSVGAGPHCSSVDCPSSVLT